jgi:predicted metalloprotease with PDZ domain
MLLAGSAIAASRAPLMTVRLAPGPMDETVNKGHVKITIIMPGVDAPAGVTLLGRAPSDLTVTDAQGVVPRAPSDKGWVPARPVKGDLTLGYDLTVENTAHNGGTTPINPRIDGKGFSALGQTFLSIPDVKTPYRILIDWDLKAMGPGATAVSSAGDGTVELPAGPVARLQRMVFMAGQLYRDPPNGGKDNFSAAWSGKAAFDLHPPMQWAANLHAYMMTFFNTPHDPAYRVFLRENGAGNPGGGVAFPNSFFATYGPTVTVETMEHILGHEMTHTFTANGLGYWYVEGDAVYYQVRLPWRAGMVSTETYLNDINLTAARYYTNAEIDASEDKVIPNFFKDPWLNTLAYDRGALYFAALDGKIKRLTGGKRSIDDLVRIMVHMQRTGQAITEQTWVDLIGKEIGQDAVALHKSMMSGGVVRPESGDFGPCFRRVDTKIRRYELGFKSKTVDGKTQVSELVEGSEAAKAGVQNGDFVVLPIITTDGVKREWKETVTVQVTRDGKTFPITYLPRGAAYDAYQWERVPGVTDSACRKF